MIRQPINCPNCSSPHLTISDAFHEEGLLAAMDFDCLGCLQHTTIMLSVEETGLSLHWATYEI